jgi:hypothetical protein
MFETVEQTLWQFLNFIVLGFFLGLGYEVFRIGRLFFKKHRIIDTIEDVLYLSICAIICFSFSMEIGNGEFRYFYVAGGIVGCFLYFMTLGQFIKISSKYVVLWIKKVFRLVFKYLLNPSRIILVKIIQKHKKKLVQNAVFIRDKSMDAGRYLKKQSKVLYNKKRSKKIQPIGELSVKSKAIQARVKVTK